METQSPDPWPFDQPKNCAVFTTRQIVEGSEPIVHVSHDEDDHGWQFIGKSGASMADAKVLCLKEIVCLDATVLEVADLPPGWIAERNHVGDRWRRCEHPPIHEEDS